MEGIGPRWGLVLLGVCAGLLSGTLGVGSGTLLIPALVLLFLLPQKAAQGTALAVMVPMVLVGALRYWINPEIKVNMSVVGLIVAGAVAGSLVGTEIANWVPGGVLRKLFAVFIIIVGVRLLLPVEKKRAAPTLPVSALQTTSPIQTEEVNDAKRK